MKKIVLLLLLINAGSVYGQINAEHTLEDFLVQRIELQQVKKDPFFLKGIYPSYINNKQKYKTEQKDLTIFYNALIDETLQKIRPNLFPHNQVKINKLLAISKELYPRFKNQKGRNTYNFWIRDSAYKFPYSWWIPIIKKDPNVPDDMDDTSLSHLALNSSKDSAGKVHEIYQDFINRKHQPLKTAAKKYHGFEAYSTWFGKKFPVVFDISVLANTLYFVQQYDLPWTPADSSSLKLILEAVDSRDYFKKARLVSPYYGTPAIVMYHLSRLMSVKHISELEKRKEGFIADTKAMYITSQSVLEKVILSTTLKRWNVETGYFMELQKNFDNNKHFIEKAVEHSDYPFFIGNIPSYFPYGIKKIFTGLDALFYYHFCPAYNDVLLLEYLKLNN